MKIVAQTLKIVVDVGLVALGVAFFAFALAAMPGAMDKPSPQQEAEDTAATAQDREQLSADLQAEYLFVLQREQAAQPDLWTPEQIARGQIAAKVAAQHTGAQR